VTKSSTYLAVIVRCKNISTDTLSDYRCERTVGEKSVWPL